MADEEPVESKVSHISTTAQPVRPPDVKSKRGYAWVQLIPPVDVIDGKGELQVLERSCWVSVPTKDVSPTGAED